MLNNSHMGSNVTVEGYEAADSENTGVARNVIGPGYFRTLGIPIVQGRAITKQDNQDARKVAVVNETFVERYLPGQDPIGRMMTFGSASKSDLDIEIVGVARNQRLASLDEEAREFVYTSYSQVERLGEMTFYLQTEQDPASVGPEVRRLVRDLDANIPVYNMATMQVVRQDAMNMERSIATIALGFALVATLLTCVGLYGLMSYGVLRRKRELGVRIALGAGSGDVVGIVVREALIFLGIGLTLGVPAALALGRLIESQLFGMQAFDPFVVSSVIVLMVALLLLAATVPATYAVRLKPMEALRYE
jgi:predicted permease